MLLSHAEPSMASNEKAVSGMTNQEIPVCQNQLNSVTSPTTTLLVAEIIDHELYISLQYRS